MATSILHIQHKTNKEFYYSVFVPSLNCSYQFRELKYGEYINFVKTLLNNNSSDIYQFILNLIHNLSNELIPTTNLTTFDVIIILLNLRAVSVGGSISGTVTNLKTQKSFSGEFKISDLTDELEKIKIFTAEYNYINTKVPINIHFGPPNFIKFCQEKYEYELIQRITIQDIQYDDKAQITQVINRFSPKKLEEITRAGKQIIDIFNISVWMNSLNISNLILSYKKFIEILNLLFRDDLKSLYQNIFLMMKEGYSEQYIYDTTIAEHRILKNISNEFKAEAKSKRDNGLAQFKL